MATDVVNDQFLLVANTLTTIRTTPAKKRDTVTVFVANDGTATTWRLTYAPAGATDAAVHTLIPNENLSGPGSGSSRPIVLSATDVLRAITPGANVTVMVNGISQDV